nr:hypothetical protein [Bradyrhizobium sp. 197]
MAKLPGFAKAFVGRWRIVKMDVWDSDFLDFSKRCISPSKQIRRRNRLWGSQGLPGRALRHPRRIGLRRVLMGGHNENDPTRGRGWAMVGIAGSSSATSTFANVAEFFNSLLGA